ncbi:pyridoxamine phosphate oxidase [Aspergillus indologenus CBS 114.80]|uniref:pyridoxal 5'-phosphate synthase n=1 Tax=Aspergillus indologenus CBS 114.80 TaxID=1450541 RepID=A0A2V5IYB2_9EURO|nr:pyridoxamine phosphate oxidase [Aspergillus indologenus CBS 114.80]
MNLASPDGVRSPSTADTKHPKKLIFAPGDIETATPTDPTTQPSAPEASAAAAAKQATKEESAAVAAASALRTDTSTPTSATEQDLVAHAARAHQFVSNPPLTVSQLHPTNPLHQFHSWFRDPRLLPASAPETCTLATAALPSGRVSARVVYLKELDERGWTVYSNWGSREGKGRDVFGETDEEDGGPRPIPEPGAGDEDEALQRDLGEGNRWAALTFLWSALERQVRVEGLVEPLSREESELYWRTRERGSQIGAWASWQSQVLWRAEPETLLERRRNSLDPTLHPVPRNVEERDIDDGREVLEARVREVERRFEGVKEIPLPPFWGGVRLVPESVEFWQGRKSRLHDRFRYVKVGQEMGAPRWRIERLSP